MATSRARSLANRAGAAARKVVPAKGTQKKTAEKAPAKKAAAKKAPAKKAPAKKAPAKKAAAKKTPAKTAAKKAPAKKAAAKKAPAKTAAKKAPAKKAPAKKAPAKKAPAKAAPAKKTSTTKTAKSAAAAVTNRSTATVKAVAKKTTQKAAQTATQTAKRVTPKKPAPRRTGLVVLETEEPWTKEEIAEVRTHLRTDIKRLTVELHDVEVDLDGLMRGAGEGAGNDPADVGSASFERDQEMTIANNAREMLQQSERALERIAKKSFGVCESCGNPIGKNRLMVFPRATMCMTCKQREERR